ncbi:MAG: hypothetical protein ACRDV9_12440 [Acidimicrobiia bacterium]
MPNSREVRRLDPSQFERAGVQPEPEPDAEETPEPEPAPEEKPEAEDGADLHQLGYELQNAPVSDAEKRDVPWWRMPWRTGRNVGRTIYVCPPDSRYREGEVLIGMMDTPELAEWVVMCHKAQLLADARDPG